MWPILTGIRSWVLSFLSWAIDRAIAKLGRVYPLYSYPSFSYSRMPSEILVMIFEMLDNKDLSKVLSTCRRWRDLGEGLWKWEILYINTSDLDMLSIRRLEHITEVMIDAEDDWSEEDLEKLFESIKNLSELTYLDMWGMPLKLVDPKLFTEVVINIEEVDLSKCELSKQQMDMLFGSINDSTRIKDLQIKEVDMSLVDADKLSAGVNQLETVNMQQTQLLVGQMTALLREAGKQTKLREVFLDSNTIDGDPILFRVDGERVEMEVVQQAKLNIARFNLKYCFENSSQWSTFKAGRITCYVTGQ